MSIAIFGGLLTSLFCMAVVYLFAVIDELSFAAIRTDRLAQVCATYCVAFVLMLAVLWGVL